MQRTTKKFNTVSYTLSAIELRQALTAAIIDGEHRGCPAEDSTIEHHQDGSVTITSTYENTEEKR